MSPAILVFEIRVERKKKNVFVAYSRKISLSNNTAKNKK